MKAKTIVITRIKKNYKCNPKLSKKAAMKEGAKVRGCLRDPAPAVPCSVDTISVLRIRELALPYKGRWITR